MIEVVDLLNQPILLESRNSPIDRVKRYSLELFSDLLKNAFDGRVAGMVQECLEDLDPLVGNPEPFGPAD